MRIILGLLVGLLVVAASSAAVAADRWYVGAGYGETDYGIGVGHFDDGSVTGGVIDDSDSGWKVLVGYHVTRRAAIEIGYVELNSDFDGQTTFSGMSDGTGTLYAAGGVSVDDEPTGLFLEIVDRIPLGRRFGFLVKLGMLHWEADVTTTDSLGTTEIEDDGTNLVYGAGLDYAFKRLALRVEWERFTNVVRDDVEMLSAGLTFTF